MALQAPINYALDIQSSFEAATDGFKFGQDILKGRQAQEDRIAAQQAAQAKAEQDAAFSAEVQAVLANPSAEGYARIGTLDPKNAEAYQKSFATWDKAKKDSALGEGMKILSALDSGNVKLAQEMMNEKAAALRNDGNEQEAKSWEDSSKAAEMNPDGARAILGGMLATLGGKDFVETYKAARTLPSDVKKAEAEAANAPLKLAADLGLTKAQTAKAINEGAKVSAETSKVLMELEAMKNAGGIDPVKKFEQEEKLRKEYTARTAKFSEMKDVYANIKASAAPTSDRGAADVALITSFMKMLDPGSVVRETEFATARDTAGLYESLKIAAGKVNSGNLLNEKQRAEYVRLAGEYAKAANAKESETRKSLEKVVDSYSLDAGNVFGTVAPISIAPPAAAPPPGAVRVRGG